MFAIQRSKSSRTGRRIFIRRSIHILASAIGLLTLFEPAHAARTLFVVGFAVPGEAVQSGIAPAFAKKWAAEHKGEKVEFQYSWGGSSVQARNVIQGLEADVVYLSDWTDVNRIAEAKLIRDGWNEGNRGIVSKSIAVFRVNSGNPKGLKLWSDLERSGVKVVTPNPRTSGAARWNLLALYGAVIKNGGTPAQAEQALRRLFRNVVTFGESGRATTQDFERGVADVAITYENEVLLRRRQGKEAAFVIPPSTIYIENAAAVVDASVEKHGNRDIAEAFVKFLRAPEAQKILLDFGFRSIDDNLTKTLGSRYPVPPQVFDIGLLGGWPKVQKDLFDKGALWDRIIRTERRTKQ